MAESGNSHLTINATAFKAKCLDLLTRLDGGKLKRVTVTKRGKPVAVVEPARLPRKPYKSAYGFLRGKVHFATDYDPFEQVVEEPEDPFLGTAGVQAGHSKRKVQGRARGRTRLRR
jgi:antitoxin (DNA-binding transcriptional repressor) of toxin-antitoxin stability system